MDQQKQYQALTDEYQGLQTELTTIVTARQKLESQHTENKSEFAGLADDAVVYKLVGPVLLKQDTSEAKSTVDGRLDYIEKEMQVRVETNIKDVQARSEGKKTEIMQMQSQMQRPAVQG
ncbi:hypothetical protein B0A54_04852 [Friedmanniomyces endolithicus]|uniref:Prefoldin subunit 6 n=1 Tax=Friedmanniomyces endolithicus TaxID=329885 RepID=A0A4U0V811_9PEZI|nr:hypothetical protein B0A54_04852 [Friedmanniomyces endolithicus]